MEREEQVRRLAYSIWEEEGCPDGRNVEHWLKAEAILQTENGEKHRAEKQPETKPVPPQRKRAKRSRVTEAR
jgi:hypothetical protein